MADYPRPSISRPLQGLSEPANKRTHSSESVREMLSPALPHYHPARVKGVSNEKVAQVPKHHVQVTCHFLVLRGASWGRGKGGGLGILLPPNLHPLSVPLLEGIGRQRRADCTQIAWGAL